MALYSGCNIQVEVPINYSEKDELISFLKSRFEGSEIKIKEATIDEPYAEGATVPEGSQLSGLQAAKEWAPLGHPAQTENTSGEFLLRSAAEAIEEFIEVKAILKSSSGTLRKKVNKILDSDPNISLKDALIRLCSLEPQCFSGEAAEIQNRLRRLKVLSW
jgi:hypothetical protein